MLALGSLVGIITVVQLLSLLALLIRHDMLRRIIAGCFAVTAAVTVGIVVGIVWHPIGIWIGLIGLYQLINALRVVENRMHWQYQRRQVLQTTLWLLLLLWLVPLFVWIGSIVSSEAVFISYSFLVLMTSAGVLATTIFHIRSSKISKPSKFYADTELPTVSILIPARNEDEDLTDCIRSAISSDYPKLEVIVLDDCSQDKSSDIIKQFAHDGVRFILGEQPKDQWLAKNQAYQTLAEAASGEWLLLSGVDVRFGSTTIRSMVTHALNTKKTMLSVMPFRRGTNFAASLLSPLRYWYEMAMPRDIAGFPAVLSTCWIIQKKAFQRVGGFEAVSRAVIPEMYFARELSRQQRYQFIRSNDYFSVYTMKSLYEQYQTALRTRYPQVHRKIETVVVATVAISLLLIGPFIGCVAALLTGVYIPALLLFLASLFLTIAHTAIITVSNPISWPLSLINFPLLALQEVGILHLSMYRYEFTEVIWKGRNVCYPVMHIVPSLPKLD